MSLIVIMGVNWIFGVLVFHEYLLPITYLFVTTTALQVCISHSLYYSYILAAE